MKKFLSLFLAVCLICSVCCGCFGGGPSAENEDLLLPETTGQNNEAETEETATEPAKEKKEKNVASETVVYDENDIKISVKSENLDCADYVALEFYIENNSETDLILEIDSIVLNGVTIDCYMYADIAAGKKANELLTVTAGEMAVYGITDIATISAPGCMLTDYDAFNKPFSFSLLTSFGEKEEFIQEENNGGVELFNRNGIQIVAKEVYQDYYGDFNLRLFIKNTSGENVTVTADNISVNDYMVNGWLYSKVWNDTWTICEISVFEADLGMDGVALFKSIAANFSVISSDYDIIMETGELTFVAPES